MRSKLRRLAGRSLCTASRFTGDVIVSGANGVTSVSRTAFDATINQLLIQEENHET